MKKNIVTMLFLLTLILGVIFASYSQTKLNKQDSNRLSFKVNSHKSNIEKPTKIFYTTYLNNDDLVKDYIKLRKQGWILVHITLRGYCVYPQLIMEK